MTYKIIICNRGYAELMKPYVIIDNLYSNRTDKMDLHVTGMKT